MMNALGWSSGKLSNDSIRWSGLESWSETMWSGSSLLNELGWSSEKLSNDSIQWNGLESSSETRWLNGLYPLDGLRSPS